MTPEELEGVRIINTLPRRLSACGFVECLGHEDFDQMEFGYMSLTVPRKTSFTSSHKRKGQSSYRARDPPTASSSRASASIRDRLVAPLTGQVTATIAPQPTSVVDLEPFVKTVPIALVVPSTKKKRKSKEGEKSSSKRSRREGSVLRPIIADVFDPEFHVSSCVTFHMSSSQRVVVELMSERELINAILELTARGSMLTWCARKLANRRSARDLQAELDEKKTSDALQA
ncbi:hypothetical protein VIGAN_07169400 [Vigna angularis var. angularis]|uniref:Uncharacterized protein n=1 Tax=Vigna angularis var. angularis TaxID=157739 RepID=A0A0S3SJ68_PHAAN|nr:hypothetical protein VIGAN_07169400 [Vigna angularis var. angularis]